MKMIFRIGHAVCLAALAVALTGCGPSFSADSDEFRILLEAYNGPDHAKKAVSVKEVAERDGLMPLSIVSKQNMTELYMGRYLSTDAAEKDLKRAQAYKSTRWGDFRPFARARTVLIPGNDIGPPEWNLLNVHPRYVYTVVIMTFYDDAKTGYFGRRQRAVDACRKLRNEGEQAYFHHGTTNSSVCIGLFKVNGVRSRMVDAPGGGGRVEQRSAGPEIQAIIKRFPKIYDNNTHRVVSVPTAKRPSDTNLQNARPAGEGQYGTMEKFYAPSYVIDIPRRPSVRDPFAGFGDS